MEAMRRQIDTTTFAPPLIAEEKDLDEMCGLIEKSVSDALRMAGRVTNFSVSPRSAR